MYFDFNYQAYKIICIGFNGNPDKLWGAASHLKQNWTTCACQPELFSTSATIPEMD
jgi:hypothetical protein